MAAASMMPGTFNDAGLLVLNRPSKPIRDFIDDRVDDYAAKYGTLPPYAENPPCSCYCQECGRVLKDKDDEAQADKKMLYDICRKQMGYSYPRTWSAGGCVERPKMLGLVQPVATTPSSFGRQMPNRRYRGGDGDRLSLKVKQESTALVQIGHPKGEATFLKTKEECTACPHIERQISETSLNEDGPSSKVEPTINKKKKKTRPAKQTRISHHEDNTKVALTPHQPSSPPTVILTNASSQGILCRLFTSDPTIRKAVHFEHFAAAMLAAGFPAKYKSGSAVCFRDERDGKGSITFHRPHPDPMLSHRRMRTWGGRLHRKFGWDLESFVVRQD